MPEAQWREVAEVHGLGCGRRPVLLLTQHADDLLLAESALPHRPSPDDGLSCQPRESRGEQVKGDRK